MSRGLIDRVLAKLVDHQWKNYGNSVTLNSYTSGNKYTVPSDGVIQATIGWNAGSYCYIFDEGGNALASVSTNGSVGSAFTSAPVFKGMKVYVQKSASNANAYFRPFVNSGGVLPNLYPLRREAVAA